MDLDLGFPFPAEPPPTCRGGRAALRSCGRRRRPLPGLGPGPAPSPNVNPTSPSPPPSVSPPPPTFPAAARSTAPTSSRGTPAPRSGTSSSTRVISVTDSAYTAPTELGWWHSWLERRSHRCFESTPEMEKFLCEHLLNQSQPIAERFRALFSLHADQATPPKQSPTPAAAMKQSPPPPDRDLYALLHLSPTASDEEIRRSYRQWAQIYHPDKYQNPQMKEVATENFQRIRDAYEILTDEVKRQIYDIYGMEGLTSGLELGPKLSKPEEIREELERLRRRKEEERASAHGRPSGSVLANLSLPQYLSGGGIVRGMAMSSEVQSQISKCTTVAVGGNMVVSGNAGTGSGTVLLRHQISPVASVELMATAGLRSLIGIQTSRQLSHHSTATSGIAVSLKDGSVNLSNTWTRQLSESTAGNVQLVLGAESNIAVGWQKKDEKTSAAGELKFGTSSFGASAHYTHHFSPKSHGRVAGRVGSTALEFEIGGGRSISDFSTIRTLYTIGIQGISWKFELHRGGQKLVIPVLLFSEFTSLVAAGALLMPSSLYFLIKKFLVKPYYLRRERQKALEKMAESSVQVREAREAAEKAQQLLENVASRKRNKQLSKDGLVITRAVYGNPKAIKRSGEHVDENDELASRVFDVTVPLNFLVTDSGQLKLHEGIKKSGIMGFCDPCPGEPKQLLVEYTVGDEKFEVVVDDLAELVIP